MSQQRPFKNTSRSREELDAIHPPIKMGGLPAITDKRIFKQHGLGLNLILVKRLVFGFFFIFLFLTQGAIVLSQSSSNSALSDVSISWMTYTSEDAIDNVDVRWQKHPYYRIVNSADGTNEAILNLSLIHI